MSYGPIRAVHEVSFVLRQGEFACLLGSNGAGKTTILKAITGLLRPGAGRISFLAEDITRLRPDRIVARGMALVPEGRRIFPQMTVLENLQLGAFLHRAPAVLRRNLDRVVTLFPRLGERRTQLAGSLSGGEQQMLGIGRALMSEPKLLLLDEPSMGLAPVIVEEIFTLLMDLGAQGTTILLVEQNASAALAITDQAFVLEEGRIVLAGRSEELAQSPAVRDAYLGGAMEEGGGA